MDLDEDITLDWSKKIHSDSRAINLLGLWSPHLKIQNDFTAGITSVTRRIRYYTLLAWYWKNLGASKIIDLVNYEKVFILATLAHHDGNDADEKIGNDLFNRQKFKGKWDSKKNFDLNFSINGFGRTYYGRQMEILRCAWTDLGGLQTSPINSKLATSLDELDPDLFKNRIYDRKTLLKFKGFCMCKSVNNHYEQEVMSKLLFGFFNKKTNQWNIDKGEYNNFLNGKVNLEFEDRIRDDNINIEDILNFENIELVNQWSLKRRNTLFIFLKIIAVTTPETKNYHRYIWDGIYYSENRHKHTHIDFGGLEKARKYWEYLQLNVYYVYAIEMFLDVIQRVVVNHPGIEKSNILSFVSWDDVYKRLSAMFSESLNSNLTLKDILSLLDKNNGNAKRTMLDSNINEDKVYDNLLRANLQEEKIVNIVTMICLLYTRYIITPSIIREYGVVNKEELTKNPLSIHNIFHNKFEKKENLRKYLEKLAKMVINTHLFEAASRFYTNRTKNWIFTEDGDKLFFARDYYVDIKTRDNRWYAIRSLLTDMGFIQEQNSKLILTGKGKKWLSKIA